MNRFRTFLPLSILLSSIPAQSEELPENDLGKIRVAETKKLDYVDLDRVDRMGATQAFHHINKMGGLHVQQDAAKHRPKDVSVGVCAYGPGPKLIQREKKHKSYLIADIDDDNLTADPDDIRCADFPKSSPGLELFPKPTEPSSPPKLLTTPPSEEDKKRAYYTLQRLNCFFQENQDDLELLLSGNVHTFPEVQESPLMRAFLKAYEINKKTKKDLTEYKAAMTKYQADQISYEQRKQWVEEKTKEVKEKQANLQKLHKEKRRKRLLELSKMRGGGCNVDPLLTDPKSRETIAKYSQKEFEQLLFKTAITPEGLLAKEGDKFSFVANLIHDGNLEIIRILYDNYMLPKSSIIQALSEPRIRFSWKTWDYLQFLYYFDGEEARRPEMCGHFYASLTQEERVQFTERPQYWYVKNPPPGGIWDF